jgi:hypothetical protein
MLISRNLVLVVAELILSELAPSRNEGTPFALSVSFEAASKFQEFSFLDHPLLFF